MDSAPNISKRPDSSSLPVGELESEIPLHSPIDNKLISFLLEHQVQELIRQGRATLIRDRKGAVRRAYLKIYPGDENNPVIWDLMNRMCSGRKEHQREVVNPAEHHWVWNHKLRGRRRFEAFAEILQEERKKLIRQMRRKAGSWVRRSRCVRRPRRSA